MINPATDCKQDLSPSDLRKMSRYSLEQFASRGSQQQRAALIDWGYSELPAFFFEHLYWLATGEEWQQD